MSAEIAVDVILDAERAQALLNPARLELLEHLQEPGSAASLARLLGQPRQRVNYHLRALEEHQLVELALERRQGSVVERSCKKETKYRNYTKYSLFWSVNYCRYSIF